MTAEPGPAKVLRGKVHAVQEHLPGLADLQPFKWLVQLLLPNLANSTLNKPVKRTKLHL